jgi:group II intron reverse transcriptase/maturase
MLNTELEKTEYKLILISEHAKRDPHMQFTSLAHLLNEEFLKLSFNSLDKNKALGLDKVSWYDYAQDLDENLKELVARLKRKAFCPTPARRVYIPKSDGRKRPLGISTIENKIVERAVAWILESIYENDFSDMSFGFRPRRNCHQALKKLNDLITYNPVSHIVEADIKGFFDNVSHEYMMKFLQIRIKDSSLLFLIRRFLQAGYVDDGLLIRTDNGTPQGSILSPILANVFLHYVLDKWFEDVVKKHTEFCEIVRYADDFVCVVRLQKDAERIEEALYKRFGRFGLEIHPDKSKRITFGKYELHKASKQKRKPNTFTFLGFTHYCARGKGGGFKIGRKTARKKFALKCKDMNQWLGDVRNRTKTKEWWKVLASKLTGHYQYYGVSENYRGIHRFYQETLKLLHKWLNRRSQKKRMNWDKFCEYLKHYPLPKPRIKHNFYTEYTCSVR